MIKVTNKISSTERRLMKTKRLLLLVVLGFLMAAAFATSSHAEETASTRTVPIPKREHGYSNFKSTVITSLDHLDRFLRKESKNKDMGWNNRKEFEKAIAEAKLDFDRESLVLLRHTEGSGSVQINFREPLIKKSRAICQIDRKEPEVGTADMAFYCFAVAVVKTDILDIELKVSGKKSIIIPLKKQRTSNKTDAGDGK